MPRPSAPLPRLPGWEIDVHDVRAWLRKLYLTGWLWHMDDDPETIVTSARAVMSPRALDFRTVPLFTDEEVPDVRADVERARRACEVAAVDIFDLYPEEIFSDEGEP